MQTVKENDIVKLLIPVSGKSEVEEKDVSFPAGTEATVIAVNDSGYYLLEIGWLTSTVSNDGLVFALKPDQFEVIKENKDKQELPILYNFQEEIWIKGKKN